LIATHVVARNQNAEAVDEGGDDERLGRTGRGERAVNVDSEGRTRIKAVGRSRGLTARSFLRWGESAIIGPSSHHPGASRPPETDHPRLTPVAPGAMLAFCRAF